MQKSVEQMPNPLNRDLALALAEEYGTPLFVYDSEIIKSNYTELKNSFSDVNLHIHYACKALNNVSVLRYIRSLGAGLDTVSIDEVQLGMLAGFKPEEIIYTPNSVSLHEISQAVELGVKVNIDNLSILEQFGHQYAGRVPVCVRINPHIMAGGNSKISTGHIDSKFGISIYQRRHLQRVVERQGIRVDGLHMHTGSDILDVDVFLKGADLLLELAHEFPDLNYIDLGSGFKVSYSPGDLRTDIRELGEAMSKRFKSFCKDYGRELALVFEPGKFLVSEAGYFLSRVNVVKHTTATVFAGIDSGLNHFIRPMFYDAYHHIENMTNPAGKPRIYTVVGYICETDTFAYDRLIPEVREDDILCFRNAGAYLQTMSSNYNARPRPAEVLIENGEPRLVSRRETLQDITARMVEL